MSIQQSILAILFAACLIQGAILGPVVARLRNGNSRAHTLLALLLLCFLPMLGEELIEVSGLTPRWPHTVALSITVDFLMAPLLLFYAVSLTDPARPRTRRDLLHFIPFLLALLVLTPFYLTNGQQKLALFESGLPVRLQIVIAAKIIVAAAYLTAVIRHLRRFLRSAASPEERDPNVVRLLHTMIGLAGLAVASVVIAVLPSIGPSVPIDSDALGALFMGASIYVISFQLMRQPLAARPGARAELPLRLLLPDRPKYGTSPLTEAQKQQYVDRLITHMESEQPYLDMQLTLEKLAAALGARPGHLSQILNERLGVNFYEFVNDYRVREVQSRLAGPARTAGTLLAHAHECGFNSKASFNRAFKRVTGKSPSAWLRSQPAQPAQPAAPGSDGPRARITPSSEATD